MEFIPAKFANDNWFVEWLTPTLSISYWDDINKIFVDLPTVTMTDYGKGRYGYIFDQYDKIKLYDYSIDAWSDDVSSRYLTGNNELDYYSNKQDWGNRVISWVAGINRNMVEQIVKEILKELDLRKPKDIDLWPILDKLASIDSKEYTIQYEDKNIAILEDKLEELDNKKELTGILSEIRKNNANLQNINSQHTENIDKLYTMLESKNDIIEKMEEYIEKLVKRWDIKKDPDFKKLMEEIEKQEEVDEVAEIIKETLEENEIFFSSLLR